MGSEPTFKVLATFQGSDGTSDLISGFEQVQHDSAGNETGRACNEDDRVLG